MKQKKKASQQDRRVAKLSGLRIRPNSGATLGRRGDLGGPDIFVETKTRMESHDYLKVELGWLEKARDQAFSMGKRIYILVISPGDNRDYVVVDQRVLINNRFGHAFAYLAPDGICLSDTPNTFTLELSEIDGALGRRRLETEEPPCYVLYLMAKKIALVIMDLEDFMEYYRGRELG